MLRVHCFQHIFSWSIYRANSGTKTWMFIGFEGEISGACFGLAVAETRKKVPVPSRKIEGLPDHLDSFTLTSL